MTLEQLRIFVEAARYNSFTLAAQQLGLTQSAVSISIRKLEEQYDVRLFDRVGRRMIVSEAGQILLDEGERILKDVALTASRIRGLQDRGRRIVLACSRNAYDYWMPGILAQVGSQGALPEIDLICGTTAEVTAWVMRGTADVGLSERAPGHAECRYFSVFRDSLLLCARMSRAAQLPSQPQWRQLAACAPLVWESGSDLEPILLEAFAQHDLDPRVLGKDKLRLTSTAAVLSLLRGGRHAGFITASLARPLLATGELAQIGRLVVPVPYWTFALQHREVEPLAALIARGACVG